LIACPLYLTVNHRHLIFSTFHHLPHIYINNFQKKILVKNNFHFFSQNTNPKNIQHTTQKVSKSKETHTTQKKPKIKFLLEFLYCSSPEFLHSSSPYFFFPIHSSFFTQHNTHLKKKHNTNPTKLASIQTRKSTTSDKSL